MGAGRGKDFGATKNVVKFMDNLLELAEYYPMSPSKYFGIKSGNKVRQILSENPLETMWDFVGRLAKGIVEISSLPGNEAGLQIVFPDHYRIVFHEKSSSDGTPAVTIFPLSKDCVIPYQKIHFGFKK